MSKILFSDLDGTLLTTDKKITETNRKAIHEMLAAGHYFVICTGRPVASGRLVARELQLTTPGCYMICFNGGVLYDCSSDRALHAHSVSIQDTLRLFEEAQKDDIHIHTYSDTDVIALKHTDELDYYIAKCNMSYKITRNLLAALDKEPQKVLLADTKKTGKLLEFQKKNADWTSETMHSFFSCEEYLEYCPKGIDKGYGVEKLCRILNIPIENSYAVGDERNDISMLKKAGLGIAMKNSHPDVLKECSCITDNDNDHDAIAEIIYKYILD